VVPGEDEGDQTREGMTGHCFQTGATQLGTSSLADVTGLKPQYVYTRVRNLVFFFFFFYVNTPVGKPRYIRGLVSRFAILTHTYIMRMTSTGPAIFKLHCSQAPHKSVLPRVLRMCACALFSALHSLAVFYPSSDYNISPRP
jgi:hypothetical protein